jgi:hypothetical protein
LLIPRQRCRAPLTFRQGFNSYTQQLCVDHAVIADDTVSPAELRPTATEGVAQSVTFKTTMIEKFSDVTSALNVGSPLPVLVTVT